MSRSTCSGEVTSVVPPRAPRGARRRAACSRPARRAARTDPGAPRPLSSRADASPIPEDAPVTTHTASVISIGCLSVGVRRCCMGERTGAGRAAGMPRPEQPCEDAAVRTRDAGRPGSAPSGRRLGLEPPQLGGLGRPARFLALFIAAMVTLRGSTRVLAVIALFAVYGAVGVPDGVPAGRAWRHGSGVVLRIAAADRCGWSGRRRPDSLGRCETTRPQRPRRPARLRG